MAAEKKTKKKPANNKKRAESVKAKVKPETRSNKAEKKIASSNARDIGIPIREYPSEDCKDPKCPFHGGLKLRGRTLKGTVLSDKMTKGIIAQIKHLRYISKYNTYEKRKSKISAYNPLCINAKTGDKVTLVECRPLSKTKKFVVVEKE